VDRFRQLMLVVVSSGVLAGLGLFVIQHFTIIPLIEKAETYETAAQQSNPGMIHSEEGWHPAEAFHDRICVNHRHILASAWHHRRIHIQPL
jgi:predicted cobalt transporter CbtA